MFAEAKKIINKDRKIQLILAGGLLIQLITCFTAIGFYHPDQHFSVIEFSSWQLGKESGVSYVWEFNHHVRPSLQIHLFSAYYLLCTTLGIRDPYLQLTILRILVGLAMFAVFNLAKHIGDTGYDAVRRLKIIFKLTIRSSVQC